MSYHEPSSGGCKALYVGHLDSRVADHMLCKIFSAFGHVKSVKVIPDKNLSHGGTNYGFIEFDDHRTAEQALQKMNGRKIFNSEIKVNWAAQGSTQKDDTSNHFHIFVGDLSPEVDDEVLAKAFGLFNSMSDARVMWDMITGKSRGFGFVAFREKVHAEQAIATMNGERLGSRAIRVNWANQKSNTHSDNTTQHLTYQQVLAQTAAYNSTVYVGNLGHNIQQHALLQHFKPYGAVVQVRIQAERGYAFVKMESHMSAAAAIVSLQGVNLNGRPMKISWGRDKLQDTYRQSTPPSFYQQAWPPAALGPVPNQQSWDTYYTQYYNVAPPTAYN